MMTSNTGTHRPAINHPQWGSDLIALALREQKFPYICLNPGASYRGLHDSLVNFLGNEEPKIIVCAHEEHAISICQGYATVTDEPLAAAVHSNVGLLHASMAIFNAWCARKPVVILGATGPVDAVRRRPWIEWIHTSADQGAVVRGYTKWDDQPGSARAAVESIRRATMLATVRPCAPVYINLDVSIQEDKLEDAAVPLDIQRFQTPLDAEPPKEAIEKAVGLLMKATRPVMLAGRVNRTEKGWAERIRLAERLGARVLTTSIEAASFPTTHPLFLGDTGWRLRKTLIDAVAECDLVLSLDWTVLGGTLSQVFAQDRTPPVINVSNDFHLHRGWNMDYQALSPSDVSIPTVPELAVSALLAGLGAGGADLPRSRANEPADLETADAGTIRTADLAKIFLRKTRNLKIALTTAPSGWPPNAMRIEHPHDYLGSNGGGGLGAGTGLSIGMALALRDRHSERLPVAVLGDGDCLMGINALWTAAHMKIPLLIIVANNRSYYNDEEHQKNVARMRGRPVENAWIGQRTEDPAVDFAGFARSQGWLARGPLDDLADLPHAIDEGLAAVADGRCYLLDVIVPPEYARDPLMEYI